MHILYTEHRMGVKSVSSCYHILGRQLHLESSSRNLEKEIFFESCFPISVRQRSGQLSEF